MTGMSGSERQAALEKILIPARIIPVLTIARVEDGVPLARALVAGGVKTLEITFRTDAAADAARAIIAEVPEAVVGIGTVLSADDLRRAQIIG
ncbi:MAG: keto-hydroxyglutarate-aldolase/keto-deoxy-phosphogluconate aldolase, partial [Afipia sp.]|nr:keto-hydroxyglutarate-aldolase/keto-deoxy-phosphogluconate aldolase [Afipia sp.]